jgi:hypothetical protein
MAVIVPGREQNEKDAGEAIYDREGVILRVKFSLRGGLVDFHF